MPKLRMFTTRNDIPTDAREKAVALLNQQLADATDLFTQIKQAHWNVKGPQFIALHELFDKLAEEVEEHIDEIAERATALGGTALGTLRLAAAASRLPEYPLDATEGRQHVTGAGRAIRGPGQDHAGRDRRGRRAARRGHGRPVHAGVARVG